MATVETSGLVGVRKRVDSVSRREPSPRSVAAARAFSRKKARERERERERESLGHLDNFINASDYRVGRRPRREINQFPRLVIRFRGTKRTWRRARCRGTGLASVRETRGEKEFFVLAHKLLSPEDGAPVRSRTRSKKNERRTT